MSSAVASRSAKRGKSPKQPAAKSRTEVAVAAPPAGTVANIEAKAQEPPPSPSTLTRTSLLDEAVESGNPLASLSSKELAAMLKEEQEKVSYLYPPLKQAVLVTEASSARKCSLGEFEQPDLSPLFSSASTAASPRTYCRLSSRELSQRLAEEESLQACLYPPLMQSVLMTRNTAVMELDMDDFETAPTPLPLLPREQEPVSPSSVGTATFGTKDRFQPEESVDSLAATVKPGAVTSAGPSGSRPAAANIHRSHSAVQTTKPKAKTVAHSRSMVSSKRKPAPNPPAVQQDDRAVESPGELARTNGTSADAGVASQATVATTAAGSTVRSAPSAASTAATAADTAAAGAAAGAGAVKSTSSVATARAATSKSLTGGRSSSLGAAMARSKEKASSTSKTINSNSTDKAEQKAASPDSPKQQADASPGEDAKATAKRSALGAAMKGERGSTTTPSSSRSPRKQASRSATSSSLAKGASSGRSKSPRLSKPTVEELRAAQLLVQGVFDRIAPKLDEMIAARERQKREQAALEKRRQQEVREQKEKEETQKKQRQDEKSKEEGSQPKGSSEEKAGTPLERSLSKASRKSGRPSSKSRASSSSAKAKQSIGDGSLPAGAATAADSLKEGGAATSKGSSAAVARSQSRGVRASTASKASQSQSQSQAVHRVPSKKASVRFT